MHIYCLNLTTSSGTSSKLKMSINKSLNFTVSLSALLFFTLISFPSKIFLKSDLELFSTISGVVKTFENILIDLDYCIDF